MSLFASLTKKPKLEAAVKKAAKARTAEDSIADQLFKEVYQDYADVMTGDTLRAATLYHWGVTLLHQAKSKKPPESINIYRNAIAKFSFCMTIDPNYLAAAIEAGVACMDLARARDVPPTDELYEMAKKQFEKANSIQSGVAAFNLACIHGIRGDNESCLEALKIAKEKGNLPDDADIINDPDLAKIVKQSWFKDFMASLAEGRRIEEEKRLATKAAAEEAKKPKPKDPTVFDPYHGEKAKESKPKSEAVSDTPEIVEKTDEVTSEANTPPKKAGIKKATKTDTKPTKS
jgi:Plant specific mitochondrial import receptor subunit TOM20